MANPLVDWIKWRIKHNKNAIIVLNGATGSGKSYTGLELGRAVGECFGTPFSVSGNVDFSFTGLLKKTMRPENREAGTAFLFEEVGAMGGGGASRDWQSRANRFFFSFMQTARHRNQILIFTTPMFSFLDAGARSLVHMQLIMSGINFKEEKAYVTPYALQVNPRTGKTYFKKLRLIEKGKKFKLDKVVVSKPPQIMIDEYEVMKGEFTSRLNQSIIADEEKLLKKEEGRVGKMDEKVFKREQVIKMLEKGLTYAQIRDALNVSSATISAMKKEWKKGSGIGVET